MSASKRKIRDGHDQGRTLPSPKTRTPPHTRGGQTERTWLARAALDQKKTSVGGRVWAALNSRVPPLGKSLLALVDESEALSQKTVFQPLPSHWCRPASNSRLKFRPANPFKAAHEQ